MTRRLHGTPADPAPTKRKMVDSGACNHYVRSLLRARTLRIVTDVFERPHDETFIATSSRAPEFFVAPFQNRGYVPTGKTRNADFKARTPDRNYESAWSAAETSRLICRTNSSISLPERKVT